MTRFVIDADTLVRIADGSVDVHPDHQLVAPGSLRSRAESLLYARVRAGELDRGAALAILERITEIKVRLLNDRVSRRVAWETAERLELPDTPAAEYLAVARLQADALVTADDELARLAQGTVRVATLKELGRP